MPRLSFEGASAVVTGGASGSGEAVSHQLADLGVEAEAFKARLGQSVLFPNRLGTSEELGLAIVDLITDPYTDGEGAR